MQKQFRKYAVPRFHGPLRKRISHAGPYLVVTGPLHKRADPLSRAFAPYRRCHVPRLYRLSDSPLEVKHTQPRYTAQEQ